MCQFKIAFLFIWDFNDRCVQWDSKHSESELGQSLVDLADEYNLRQVIDKPTRENILLDLLFSNCPNYLSKFQVIDPIDNLDHSIITGLLKAKYTSQLNYKRTVRHFTDEKLETLSCKLQEIDWHTILLKDMTADECAETFATVLTRELDLAIPPITITVRPSDKPGMTSYVRKLFKLSHVLYRRARQTKSEADNTKHCFARRKAKKAWFVTQQKHNAITYAKATGPGGRSKAFWKILK